jgi:outer membrane receptor protein involved in Fe transport
MSLHRLAYLTILLAAIGTATAAFAQSTTTTTTTIEKRSEPARLTPQQRTVVYRTVTRERRVAPPVDVEVRMGAVVPPAVVLSPFPDSVYVDAPNLTQYKYFYVNNRLVLVDPRTSEVIDIIEQ